MGNNCKSKRIGRRYSSERTKRNRNRCEGERIRRNSQKSKRIGRRYSSERTKRNRNRQKSKRIGRRYSSERKTCKRAGKGKRKSCKKRTTGKSKNSCKSEKLEEDIRQREQSTNARVRELEETVIQNEILANVNQ